LHDLRHSFATFAVESGASLYHVGRALGHAKASTTERYAHPSDAGARAVASEVATRFVTATKTSLHALESQLSLPFAVNGSESGRDHRPNTISNN
jgi:hypothetical protein